MVDGSSYEILTQSVYQAIQNLSGVKTIKVQQNVSLQGKSAMHQIDVYWELEQGGIVYKTLVQAKDWRKAVDQGEVIKFKGVLDDLPGQPRGIVVARSGFQEGAIAFAKRNDILLLQLDEAVEPPARYNASTLGYVEIVATRTPLLVPGSPRVGYTWMSEVIVCASDFKRSKFNADIDWMKKSYGLLSREARKKATAIHIRAIPHEIKLYDDQGNEAGTVHRVYRGFVDKLGKEIGPKRFYHKFDTPTFLKTGNAELPLIKILGISSTVRIVKKSQGQYPWRLPNMVQYVLRDVNKGTVRIVGTKVPPPVSQDTEAKPQK